MEENKNLDKGAAAKAAKEVADKATGDANEAKGLNRDGSAKTQQTAIEGELEKIAKEKKTKISKLKFSRNRIDEQLAEYGEEVEPTNDNSQSTDEDDNKPVTVGMLKKLNAAAGQRTALQMADTLTDEKERELVKNYLQTRIIASGDPESDFKLALSAVSSMKNSQIAQEVQRKAQGGSRTHGTGSGAPANIEQAFEPTAEESAYMRPPFNLKQADIIRARKATETKQK